MFTSKIQSPVSVPSVTDFDFLNRIGTGRSATVHLVQHKVTGRRFALKAVERASGSASAVNEQAILKHISVSSGKSVSPSLLSLHASWEDDTRSYMLSEWCPGRDLSPCLVNGHKRWGAFPAAHIRFIVAQLVTALESLHAQHIVHRNLKPAHIFFTEDGNIVLGGLSLAKHLPGSFMHGNDEPAEIVFDVAADADCGSFFQQTMDEVVGVTRERCGTPGYMAPAQVQGTPYSFDADLFALGVIAHQLATGAMPSSESPELLATVDVDLKAVIQGLLDHNRETRLTLAQLKEHRYFTGVNWKKVARHQVPAPWVPVAAEVPSTIRVCPFPAAMSRSDSSFDFVSRSFARPQRGLRCLMRKFVSEKPQPQPVAPVVVAASVVDVPPVRPSAPAVVVAAPVAGSCVGVPLAAPVPKVAKPVLPPAAFSRLWYSATSEKIAALQASESSSTCATNWSQDSFDSVAGANIQRILEDRFGPTETIPALPESASSSSTASDASADSFDSRAGANIQRILQDRFGATLKSVALSPPATDTDSSSDSDSFRSSIVSDDSWSADRSSAEQQQQQQVVFGGCQLLRRSSGCSQVGRGPDPATGYREGITAGKESALQEGFDAGFAEVGAPLGQDLGFLRGKASAFVTYLQSPLSSLVPDDVKTSLLAEAREIATGLAAIRFSDVVPRDLEAEEHARQHLAYEDTGLNENEGLNERREMEGLEDMLARLTPGATIASDQSARPTINDVRALEGRLRVLLQKLGLPPIDSSYGQ
ncbi:unnamed protein product [Mycena citricolor]|uniref:cAMP-dependent protein kinase n=1 Tax=Mycena citricolor TaxID=2018698 RepID=A0AAD2H9G7_9AGAR|nr:unnamed protein product [Mycena citricolor]